MSKSSLGRFATALLAPIAAGCLFTGGPGGPEGAGRKDPGMAEVPARGKSFLQGSESPLAAAEESPPMANRFSYGFRMDRTEVTQASFEALMGWNPVSPASPFGRGGTHPVYDVTWFDAALYCNTRSRRAGLDTVYAYDRAERAATGNVFALAGLTIRLDKAGYRLPTEAEWEFAARGGAVTDFTWGDSLDAGASGLSAWFEGNAGNTSHPVGTLAPNAFGLFDMAGNVMEWINDWKGTYPGEGTEDFAGARDPGPQGEKPVKGGAFPYGMRQLRPANRSATYATAPSAKAHYVGFRCVVGAIGKPRFSSGQGSLLETDPVVPASLRLPGALVGRGARLALVNAKGGRRHLAYVDYGRYPPLVHEFADIGDVHYPVISPDGHWVAFGTAPEGAHQGSRILIRALSASASRVDTLGEGFIPRWSVNPAARDTFLTYTSSSVSNLDDRWKGSRTLRIKVQGGKPTGSPEDLGTEGGFHDGVSRDGRWMATGYQTLRLRDMEMEKTRVLFTAPRNGKAEGDTSQVCNVSIAPDSTGRTLFLDFGYPTRSAVTGMSYGIHQVAFVSDTAGRILQWYPVPAEEASWDEMEWSNDPRYAASSARDGGDRHRNVYLLDLETGKPERLVSGFSLLQPSLWVDPAPTLDAGGLDLDSLGQYNDPPTEWLQTFFADKMLKFWKGRLEWEILVLGSSHAHYGIDPTRFTAGRAFNLAYYGAGGKGSRILTQDYALNLCPRLKTVVVEAFAHLLCFPGGDRYWDRTIGLTKGYAYDRSHGFWKGGVPPHLDGLLQQAPHTPMEQVDPNGWESGVTGRGWGPNPPPSQAYPEWDLRNEEYVRNLADMRAFAQELADRKIHVWFVNYPVSPGFRNGTHYQTYGPGWETGRAIMRDMAGLETLSPYVHFHDAYADGNHDYSDAEAMDADHLNGKGAAKLTGRLDSLIRAASRVVGAEGSVRLH